jgi:hypothetical protein
MSQPDTSERDEAAHEYAVSSVPFECEDSEGMYVEEVYPAQIREVSELGFRAGWDQSIKHDERVLKLVEALEAIANNYHAGKFQADARLALKEWKGAD